MPRANRYFIPGHDWHIIHSCHKKGLYLNSNEIESVGYIGYGKLKSALV